MYVCILMKELVLSLHLPSKSQPCKSALSTF